MSGVTNPNIEQQLAEEMLKRLEGDFQIVKGANRKYASLLNNDGSVNHGTTFTIPAQNYALTASDSKYSSLSGSTDEQQMTMKLDKQTNAKWVPNVEELQFFVSKNQKERFENPRIERIAADVEADVSWRLFRQTYRFNGQAGVKPSDYSSLAFLAAAMDSNGIPARQRWLVLANLTAANISFSGFLSQDKKVSRAFTRRGVIPANTMDFDQILKSRSVIQHQAGIGDLTATPVDGLVACGTVKTDVPNGATQITLTGLGTSTDDVLREGDKLVIPSLKFVDETHKNRQPYAVSVSVLDGTNPSDLPWPIDPQDTRHKFASDASGDITITYCESATPMDGCLYFSGAKKNIEAQITAGTVVYLVTNNSGVGSTTKEPYEFNISYYTQALQFAAPPMPGLDNQDRVASLTPLGIATGLTWFRDKDINAALPTRHNRWRFQWARRVFPSFSWGLLA